MAVITTRKDELGKWWFVSADGEDFISLGINHVEPHLLLGDYNMEHSISKFGEDLVDENGFFNPEGQAAVRWIDWVTSLLNKWNFNTFAYHTYVPRNLVSHRYFMSRIRPYDREPYNCYERPDVFSQEFKARVEACVRPWCMNCMGYEKFLGYAFEDVPDWAVPGKGGKMPIHAWAKKLMDMPAYTPGKQAFIGTLRTLYYDAKEAGCTYGMTLTPWDWDSLLNASPFPQPVNVQKATRDGQVFLEMICDKWYRTLVEAVRNYDKEHLILGAKVGFNLPDWLLKIIGKYFDVISIQWYARYEEQADKLKYIHEFTGKPILMGDSSFSVIHPQQANSKGVHVDTDEQVGIEYKTYLEKIIQLPFILGWHHCGYMEGWEGLTEKFPGNPICSEQCGFVDPFGKPFASIRNVMLANRKAVEWHKK